MGMHKYSRVNGGRANYAANWIAVTNGIAQKLHIQSSSAFSTAIPIGGSIKCVTSRCRGKDTQLCSVHVLVYCDYQIDTANNGTIAIPAAKCMARIVERVYGRRACGVNGKTRETE